MRIRIVARRHNARMLAGSKAHSKECMNYHSKVWILLFRSASEGKRSLHSYLNIWIRLDSLAGKHKGWCWCYTGLSYGGIILLPVNKASSY